MDFFEHQAAAQRKTGRLVVLMVTAVVLIIALIYVVVLIAFTAQSPSASSYNSNGITLPADVPYLSLLGLTTAGVLLVVGGGSLFKTAQLAGGGAVVASSLGGREIDPDTAAPDERQLLNIVEEMAIASGSAVPRVFLMDDEPGINAFAAGWSVDQAVIGVTRGALDQLRRDELQGVIAHEFSHILHGDMRLNLRLVGIIFGILVISLIGSTLFRTAAYARPSRSSRSKNNGGAMLAMIGLGIALYLIGGLGVLFGRLIQAGVSRQREFLADASAVQYTRNPTGLAGALKTLGGYDKGSRMRTAHAMENRHFFFGESGGQWLSGAFATHPPLEQRIARLDPAFPKEPHAAAATSDESSPRTSLHPAASGFASVQPSVLEQIGKPSAAHVEMASNLLADLPSPLREALRQPAGASAVVLALLLDRRDPAVAEGQQQMVTRQASPAVSAFLMRLASDVAAMPLASRLPVLDLAVPALKRLARSESEVLLQMADRLLTLDGRIEPFEWALQMVLRRRLQTPGQTPGQPPRQSRPAGKAQRSDAHTLLQFIARYAGDPAARQQAFAAGLAELSGAEVATLPDAPPSWSAITQAVERLAAANPKAQRQVVVACMAAVSADGHTTVNENELLRAVAEALGVPVPPLLPGQTLR